MEIIKFLNNISYKKLRYTYIMLIFHLFFIRYISVFVLLPNVLKSVMFMPLAGLGALVVLFGLAKKEIEINLKQNIWLFLFLAVFIASSIVNFRYGFVDNIKSFGWTAVSFFVFFFPPKSENIDEKEKLIIKIQDTLIIYTLVFSGLSLLTFVLQTNYFSQLNPTEYFALGYIEHRLHGVYPNPNGGAFVSFLSIIFSCKYFFENKKKSKFYIANIIIQFCYISLANSRGTFMVLLMIVSVFFPLFFYKNRKFNNMILRTSNEKDFKLKKTEKWYVAICSICGAAVIFSLLYFSLKYTREIFSYVPQAINFVHSMFYSETTDKPNFIMNFINTKIQTDRVDFVDNADISNLRFSIWLNAWDIFKTSPILGVSPQNVVNIAKDISPLGIIAVRNYARIHSTYIDILLCTGILGFCSMAIFYVQSLWTIIKFYIKSKFNINNVVFVSSLLCVISLLVFGLVESMVMLTFSMYSIIFWVFFDYTLSFCRKEIQKLSENSKIV